MTTPTGGPTAGYEPDPRWVPVDRRWCGLDRVTLAPAVAVLALWVLMAVVIPVVNDSADYTEQVTAGDVIQLSDDVTFVPEPGWGITAGVRRGDAPATGYPDTATVVDGDTSMTVVAKEFDGDEDDLLTHMEAARTSDDADIGSGPRSTVITDQGRTGVTVELTDAVSRQVLGAFVIDGIGIRVLAIAPPDATNDDRDAVGRMIRSVRREAVGND
ncbi:hypothetical protein A5733_09650 [Mycobacterium sp. NS-7484]|uniref:hypothetical protein n=1 Tax=Mycobacterium sp. NS-7484 TaxID=1834161 RepID=UPI00096FECEC|nr:hypothetical protein [Mycobacterium sp. NS-7484]OMB97477.1 hypothetical protein A5733_09650 [Mycobacterium sp. NS-7484]